MDEVQAREVEDIIHTEEGTKVLTALVKLFLDVKDDTFAAFDEQYDSAAESEAAKTGWQTLATGVGLIAILNKLDQSAGAARG